MKVNTATASYAVKDQHLSFAIGTQVRVKVDAKGKERFSSGMEEDGSDAKGKVTHHLMKPPGTEGLIEDVSLDLDTGSVQYQAIGCAWWDHDDLEFVGYPTAASLAQVVKEAREELGEDEDDAPEKDDDDDEKGSTYAHRLNDLEKDE